MTLYHFTPKHLWKRIEKEGLTQGAIPARLNPVRLLHGWRWLTQNAEFSQSWNTQTFVTYDRAAVRIEIEIPESQQHKLHQWIKAGPSLAPDTFEDLTRFGDPENWWVFQGDIAPDWFVHVSFRPWIHRLRR